VRKKNVLSTLMQSFAITALVTVLWWFIGYSLAFTPATASSAAPRACSCTGRFRWLIPRPDRLAPGADDPGSRVFDVSADLRHHHPGADLRSFAERHEILAPMLWSWASGRCFVRSDCTRCGTTGWLSAKACSTSPRHGGDINGRHAGLPPR